VPAILAPPLRATPQEIPRAWQEEDYVMTQRPSPDRLLRRPPNVVGLDTRPDPTYALTTDVETAPADGTVLDAIPLPGTDKVLMIVAHVVPARTVRATKPLRDAQPAERGWGEQGTIEPEGGEPRTVEPGGGEPGLPATNDPADPRSNATTRDAKAADTSTAEGSPEPAIVTARTPPTSEPGPEAPEPLRTAAPEPLRTSDARQTARPQASRTPETPRTATPESRAATRDAPRTPTREAPRTVTREPSRATGPYAMNPLDATPLARPEPPEPREPQDAQEWGEPGEPRSETAAARAEHPAVAETPASPPPDGLRVDRPSRRVLVDDREVHLTFQEFELLAHLTAHPWTVFTRAELMRALWPSTDPATRTVDIHVHRLRRKLGRLSTQLTTVRRVGYVYRPHLTNRATTPTPSRNHEPESH
jgi:DNA-binding winged helix-turn-helix (wHTH) protein